MAIRVEPPEETEQHPFSVYGCGVHYSFVLDFGPGFDIRKATRRLLGRDLGVVASVAGSDELRVNRGIVKIIGFRDSTDRLVRFLEELNSENPSWANLLRIDPWHTIRIILIFFRSVLRRKSSDRNGISSSGSSMSDIKNRIDHIPDDMSRVVIDRMIMLGARLRPEEALHFPSYFRSEPYIRVSLQRCFFKSEVDEECHEGAIEVSLILNHSGIGILTLSVDLAEELSFEMAQKAMSPKWLLLGDLSLSQPLVEAGLNWRQRRRCRFKWEESSRAEGVLWRTFAAADGQSGFFVSDVFKTYVDAVCGAVSQSLRHEWHVHPILSLGKPLCGCSENQFTVTHRDHLTALVRRTAPDVKYAPSVHDAALLNVLPTTDVALYISSATAILIDYKAESSDFMRDMTNAVIPIESALSQHAQLRQIDILTSATRIRDQNLFTAQQLLTTGLTEYQRDIYTNETMQLVVDAVLEHRRTAQLYSRLLDRVRSLEALVTSNYSRTQNRRSLGLSIAGFCVVLLLLLPRIAEAYDAFGRMGRWPSNVVSDVNDFTGGREATILIFYLLVAVSAVAALASISVRWRRPRRRRRFGHSLEGKFSLELTDGRANPPTRRDQIASLAEGSDQDQ